MSGLIQPKDALAVVTLDLQAGRLSDFGRELMRGLDRRGDGLSPLAVWAMGLRGGGKSDYLENKNLDHNLGDGAYTMPTTVALALCTSVPTDASTGATIVEATYTGYARLKVEAAQLSAAASGSKTNSAELTFANCTAGSSTITAWALLDSSTIGAGNSLYWGTATSTVISTTQTPPSIAAAGLVCTED